MRIRNELNLWDDNKLNKHFKVVHNCNHPDDMSDLIIRQIYKVQINEIII